MPTNSTAANTTSGLEVQTGLAWTDGRLLFIAFAAIWGLHVALFVEHLAHLATTEWKLRFQALYVRLTGMFPVLALVSMVGAYQPSQFDWVEFVYATLEAYILAGFVALLYGFGKIFTKDIGQVFLESRFAAGPFPLLCPKFTDPRFAERYWRVMILQFSVIKPITALIPAVMNERAGTHLAENDRLSILLRVIAAISIAIAVVAILRVHNALAYCKENPYGNHRVFLKVFVMKLLFTFIILNNLIVRPLVASGTIPVSAWMCPPDVVAASDDNAQECRDRLLQIAFLAEIVIMTVPLVFLFRRHQLVLEEPRRASPARIARFLCLVMFPFDLHKFWNGSFGSQVGVGGERGDGPRTEGDSRDSENQARLAPLVPSQ